MSSASIESESIDSWATWESYENSYNLYTKPSWGELFVRFLIQECEDRGGQAKVLDVGCGRGIARKPLLTARAREHMGELWGIEPDVGIEPPEDIFDNYQHALMETADLPEGYFDVIYSFLVIEHLEDPEAFVRAVHRALKPGGVHYFMTPNGRHYFSRIVRLFKKLHIEELILRVLRGKQKVEEYHYPVQHKFNAPSQIEPLCESIGFEPPSYVFVEFNGPKPYFPGPLRPIWWLLMKKREFIRRPELLLEMYVKMRKNA